MESGKNCRQKKKKLIQKNQVMDFKKKRHSFEKTKN